MSPAVSVHNLSKIYRFYPSRLSRFLDLVGLERLSRYKSFPALQDISFTLDKGSTVGIIGQNGSGKSTLLKILSGITTPTSGGYQIDGRVISLLNLGAGFDPDFTGRENVKIQGAIMGLSGDEIESRMDDITRFSDLGPFIDRPTRSYSKGMYFRLAFAAAIHIDPDVLILDEVLAVGDAFFQHKCFTKFQEFREQGITIIVVTHNLPWITTYCDRALLIDNGKILRDDEPKGVVDDYNKVLVRKTTQLHPDADIGSGSKRIWTSLFNPNPDEHRYGNMEAEILEAGFFDKKDTPAQVLRRNFPYSLKVRLLYHNDMEAAIVSFAIKELSGTTLCETNTYFEQVKMEPVEAGAIVEVRFHQTITINPGNYLLCLEALGVIDGKYVSYDRRMDYMIVEIIADQRRNGIFDPQVQIDWTRIQ